MHLVVNCENVSVPLSNSRGNGLDIFYGETTIFESRVKEWYRYLPEDERTRAKQFKYEIDYCNYVASHALLNNELSNHSGIQKDQLRIERTGTGKPFLSDIDLSFSLSRNREKFAFAIGAGKYYLGIDLESIRSNIDFVKIAYNYFSQNEIELLLSSGLLKTRIRNFYELWTRREAILKAIGVGINTDLKKIKVLEGGNIAEIEGSPIESDTFFVKTFLYNNAIISFASSINITPGFIDLSTRALSDF